MIIGWNNREYPANTGVHFVETHFGLTGWRLIKNDWKSRMDFTIGPDD
jgi:hypothetical protein